MADILIRGMEMPENCGNCFFCDDWAKCQLLNLNNIFDYCKDGIERPVKCPLVPLPEGHGRLIDADAIEYTYTTARGNDDGHNWRIFAVGQDEIDDMPTIVPAEGGGEDGDV